MRLPQGIERKKRHWLADHRGVQKAVAEAVGVTASFVHGVYWGKFRSRSGEVENRLAALGAPGVARRESAGPSAGAAVSAPGA